MAQKQQAQPKAGTEQIQPAYQGLPLWRTAAWLLLHFTAVPMAASFGWYTYAFYVLSGRMRPQELSVILVLACYLLALLAWKLARPATSAESLNMTKITNVFVMFAFALKCMHVYKYHVMDLKQYLFPRRLWKHLSEEEGYTSSWWLPFFTTLEATADGGCLIFMGLTLFCFQNYISGKMVLVEKLKKARESGNVEAIKEAEKAGFSWTGKPSNKQMKKQK